MFARQVCIIISSHSVTTELLLVELVCDARGNQCVRTNTGSRYDCRVWLVPVPPFMMYMYLCLACVQVAEITARDIILVHIGNVHWIPMIPGVTSKSTQSVRKSKRHKK